MPIGPPTPQVVRVTATPGGFGRALGIIIGLFAFAAVFGVGLAAGVIMMIAGRGVELPLEEHTYRDGGAGKIAVLPIEGAIDPSMASFVHVAVDQVLDDSSVDAVILRVDSPGGGVTASDQIWKEVERLKAGRRGRPLPVVASYGGLAASGGYYVSCGADHIIAEETCITGSIGVIAQVLTFEDLFEKVGVEAVTLVASGSPEKDIANNLYRDWDERDRQRVIKMLDAAYEIFTERVTAGRQAAIDSPGKVAELADGSIYTTAEALENGLIDGVGYLDDAIAEAERRAGLTRGRASVVVISRPVPSVLGLLLGSEPPPVRSGLLDAEGVRSLVNELGSPRMMYLMQ